MANYLADGLRPIAGAEVLTRDLFLVIHRGLRRTARVRAWWRSSRSA